MYETPRGRLVVGVRTAPLVLETCLLFRPCNEKRDTEAALPSERTKYRLEVLSCWYLSSVKSSELLATASSYQFPIHALSQLHTSNFSFQHATYYTQPWIVDLTRQVYPPHSLLPPLLPHHRASPNHPLPITSLQLQRFLRRRHTKHELCTRPELFEV